jgi:hypothetical protein
MADSVATSDEPTGNFGSALEDRLFGDFRLVSLFAGKTLQAIFGVLQHNPLITGLPRSQSARLKRAIAGTSTSLVAQDLS